MSLRWRAHGGALLCGAKHAEMENDTYIDDNLHYHLAVVLNVVVPQDDEHESGIWHWINEEAAMSRAREWDFSWGRLIGGFTFYPYQLAVGGTIRYWPGVFAPSIRIHLGPFKFWCSVLSRRKEEQ